MWRGYNRWSSSDGEWTSLSFSHALFCFYVFHPWTKQFSCLVHGDGRWIECVSQRIISLVFCWTSVALLSFPSSLLHPGEGRRAEAKTRPSQRKPIYFSSASPELKLALLATWLVFQNRESMQGQVFHAQTCSCTDKHKWTVLPMLSGYK